MKQTATNILLTILFCLGNIFQAHAVPLPPVVIKTYGEHRAGNLVYHHLITNNGARPVGNFILAYQSDEVSRNVPAYLEVAELYELLPKDSATLAVSPALYSAPVGWKPQIIELEESGYYLKWYAPSVAPFSIQTGQTAHFSITVPTINSIGDVVVPPTDSPYLIGHFQARYDDMKEPLFYNGIMERLDTTPPALTVTLIPSTFKATGGMVTVNATINVKDNYDPSPEIKLVSVTSSNPAPNDVQGAGIGTDDRQFSVLAKPALGAPPAPSVWGSFLSLWRPAPSSVIPKTYTVTYSATDGSGNKALSQATITVTP